MNGGARAKVAGLNVSDNKSAVSNRVNYSPVAHETTMYHFLFLMKNAMIKIIWIVVVKAVKSQIS